MLKYERQFCCFKNIPVIRKSTGKCLLATLLFKVRSTARSSHTVWNHRKNKLMGCVTVVTPIYVCITLLRVFCTHTVHKWWTLWCHSLVNEASSCLGKLEVVREGRREANDASCNEHTLSELPVSLSLSWIPQPINLWNHSDLIRSLSKGAAFNKHKSFCSPIRRFDALVCWLQFRNKNYVHHFTPTTFFFLVNVLTSCEPLLARL